MAYIFRKRKNGKPVGNWYLGYGRRRKNLKTKDKSIAAKHLARWILNIDRVRVGEAVDITVAGAVEQFHESRALLAEQSRAWYRKRVGLWAKTLPPGLLLRDVTPASLEKYKLARGKIIARRTLAGDLTAISVFLRWACDVRRYLPASPMTREIRRVPHLRRAERLALSEEQVKLYRETLWGYWLDFFTVAIHTGLRLGELIHLERSDFDLVAGLVLVREKPHFNWAPKDGPRELPIAPELLPVIDRLPAKGPLFPTPTGCLWQPTNLDREWYQLLQGYRLPPERPSKRRRLAPPAPGEPTPRWPVRSGPTDFGVTIHELRNTYATRHVLAGTDVGRLSLWLGHAHLSTTDIYFTPQRLALKREKPPQ